MKNLLIIILITFSLSNCFAQENDLYVDGLFGSVKSVIELNYLGKISKGNVIKKNLRSKTEFIYNEQGYKLKKIKHSSVKPEYNGEEVYTYNLSGHLIEFTYHYPLNMLVEKRTYLVDPSGQTLEINFYRYNGEFDFNRIIRYNDQGLFSEFSDSSTMGISTTFFVYGTSQELLTSEVQNKKGIYSVTKYEYDENLFAIKIVTDFGGTQQITTITRDTNGNILDYISIDEFGREVYHKAYKYDVFENIVEEVYFSGYKGKIENTVSSTYDYDNENNWTKKISIDSRNMVTIKERVIEYYE